jgi:hypothetical protein
MGRVVDYTEGAFGPRGIPGVKEGYEKGTPVASRASRLSDGEARIRDAGGGRRRLQISD